MNAKLPGIPIQPPFGIERKAALIILDSLAEESQFSEKIFRLRQKLAGQPQPIRRDIHIAMHDALLATRSEPSLQSRQALIDWKKDQEITQSDRYSSHLYSQTDRAAHNVAEIQPVYSENSPTLMAFDVLNACFDAALARDPRVVAFGEDVGNLGDVNQAFRNLQEKYGRLRVTDTGIREVTILGQAIGLAMRGLRPIAEIQYLDYLLYVLQLMSDDLATLLWRTKGGQKAPVIIRTRGHRLEGIWHSGSPMAGIIQSGTGHVRASLAMPSRQRVFTTHS